MSPKAIPTVTTMHIHFDSLVQSNDQEIVRQMVIMCRLSKKKILPKSLVFNGYRVDRGQNIITIHLHQGETETGRFSFVPMSKASM